MPSWKALLAAAAIGPSLAIAATLPAFATTKYTNASGNPFEGKQIYANPYYASEIASSNLSGDLALKAAEVAKVGTFFWLSTNALVPTMSTYLDDIEAKNAAGANPEIIGTFVVYNLPDRDCSAAASGGELTIANNGSELYKEYINSIVQIIKAHPKTTIVLIVEPDSIPNIVSNLDIVKCANAKDAYLEGINYALLHLNHPNTHIYLDAGNAGWLGWGSNLSPAATLYGSIYQNASSPSSVRGLSSNIANFNNWNGPCANYTTGNDNCNEQKFVNALAPLLTTEGFPAHFIIDTSRNGVNPQPRVEWGDWCNVAGAGFGVRPTTNTNDSLADAFVWVKPGGESDGTSDNSTVRYDAKCGLADAVKPAPEAGSWFQTYFEMLLTNANPSF